MRKSHKAGKKYAGVNVFTGQIEDMLANDIIEPFRVGKQAISSATDAAIMILRIDDVIASKGGSGGNPQDMAGQEGMGDVD
jgi:chaperonin GroEL (HSP60 family)